ncbi:MULTISPECIES: lamin tail domain-containing protein [Haloferax]|uniref:Endonuclease n=1 Tax=Haloferax marinum TaxID=2666143 RepID=A0A6A8G2D4_9EURY|nr:MULTISPECIES: lamin tail domain-containing protein [Haloferax]KAB1196304.1 endonuclease [Haloferax sp. CBA1150]MRW95294.1 endonuclease [Haloferax marinum]
MVRGATTTLVIVFLIVFAGCLGSGDVASDTTTPTMSPTATPTSTPTGGSASGDVTVEVVEVVDGDTVKVVMPDGARETVRLLGVDTPEVYGENTPDEFEGVPDTEAGKTCLREAGYDASDFAKSRLEGKTVELRYDEKAGERGYYGRLLAYVVVDGTEFNYDLLTEGHARFYESSFEERERYERAERDARERGVGLWSCATEGSAAGGSDPTADGLSVSVVADAPGNDNDNLDEEYVTLHNGGDDAIDLSGWTVSDAVGATYTFSEGTELAAGAKLTLYTGSGTDAADEVYWGRSSAVWNNGGDTVTVRNAAGDVVLSYTYE